MNAHQELIIAALHNLFQDNTEYDKTIYAALDWIKSIDAEYLLGREEELTKQMREFIRVENILMECGAVTKEQVDRAHYLVKLCNSTLKVGSQA